MPRANQAASRQMLWWLSPPGLIFGFLVPIFLVILFLGQIDSAALTIRGGRYLDVTYTLVGLAYMALMALAAMVGAHIELKPHGPVQDRAWTRPAWVLGVVGFLAYLYWFKEFALNPALLLQLFSGPGGVSRDDIGQTAGITSLVNLLPVFFALVSYVWATDSRQVSGPLKCFAVLLVFMTLFRVYVWSERLALVEMGMAIAVPAVMVAYQRSRSSGFRLLVNLLPLLALPLLVGYFAAAEYFRSWQSATYQGSGLSFWEFALGRLATYYYTSLNNGVGMLETHPWPTYQMESVLLWAYKAPLLVGPIFSYYAEGDLVEFGRFLKLFADPEFNNPSGIYAVMYDVGVGGAAVYLALLGFLAGLLCRALWQGRLRGVVLYPSFMVMLLEIYRYPYLGHPRAFTVMLGALLVFGMLWFSRSSRRMS